MGDQDATSTSTTTPKNDLQKVTQSSLRLHSSFWSPIEDTNDRPRSLTTTTFGRGSMTTVITYNSTKGHPTEARQSSSGTTLRFKPNCVQASGSRSTSLSPSTRGQGNQYSIHDGSKGRRYITTSTTTQELTPSKVLESLGKSFQPHRPSPASIKVPNHRTTTHCRHVPKETKIHITSGVSNPPREATLPRHEDSMLTNTYN